MPSPAQPSVFGAQHLIDRLRCWVRRPLIFQSRLSPPLRRDALGHQAVGAAERFAWLTPELDPRGADEIGTKSTTVKIAAAIYVRCRGSMSAIVLGPHSDRWKRTAGVGKGFGCRPGESSRHAKGPAYESHRRTNRRDSG